MMGRERLHLLYVSPFPPGPPTFGAQRRIQGLLSALARHHDVSAVSLIPPHLDAGETERSMRPYCQDVILVPGRPWQGPRKRLGQLRSLFSHRSFERRSQDIPALRAAIDSLLSRRQFDIVNVEFPFLAQRRLVNAASGRPPRLVLGEHNIEYDLGRQQSRGELGFTRRLYNSVNW